ncbi:MAG: hypothetical protein H8E66_31125 [Planctomycetes bacterium]|nr:hypothetical protein [Planctomycetota bacterium]
MAKPSKPVNGGLTPGKGIAIGILSVVLLVVIVTQFGEKKKRSAVKPRARKSANESKGSQSPTPPVASSKRSENPWPVFEVAEVVASNPFLLPDVLRPKREDTETLTPSPEEGESEATVAAVESAEVRELRRRQAEFMASLRSKGVDMILRSSRGSVARVGDVSLRIGDVFEGLRVEEIGQDGIVFAPVAAGDW